MKFISMLKNKIKILRIIHTLDPASGGPQNAILSNNCFSIVDVNNKDLEDNKFCLSINIQ